MTAVEITSVQLSTADEVRLAELETVVEVGLETFVAVGNALAEIAECKLYRGTHGTFEAYVKDRFNISRAYAYRKIQAAKVAEIVSPMGDIVPNERQARELTGLDETQVRETWDKVVNSTSKPTVADVTKARSMVAPRSLNKTQRAHAQDPNSFINVCILHGTVTDETTRQQFERLDWSRLDRRHGQYFIDQIKAARELLLNLEIAVMATMEATV